MGSLGDGIVLAAARGTEFRTAPLWGVRLHSRLMHDGASTTFSDAIRRHRGEAAHVTEAFEKLTPAEKKDLLTFLLSL